MLKEDVIDEVESHGEEKLYEDRQYREEEGTPRNKIRILPAFLEELISFSLQNLLKKLVLGFVVRHPVVDLDGIHDKDVADDGNDELRDPVGVTEREKKAVTSC